MDHDAKRPTPAFSGMGQPLSSEQARRVHITFQRLQQGDSHQALREAHALVQEAPLSPDALNLLGVCLGSAGHNNRAELALQKALTLAPAHPLIVRSLSRVLRAQGRHREALQLWRQQRIDSLADTHALQDLTQCALECREHDVAAEAARALIKIEPRVSLHWHLLGLSLSAMEDLEGAERAFRECLSIDRTDTVGVLRLGHVLRLQGRIEVALDLLSEAQGEGVDSPELRDLMSGVLLDAGRTLDAFANACHLVEAHPERPALQRTLAQIRWEYGQALGDLADPLEGLEHALREQPSLRELRLSYAALLLETKRLPEAIEQVRRLRAEADHPILLALEANALESAGESASAAPLYAQAYRHLGNRDASFLNAYVRHLLRSGRWKEAAVCAQSALRLEPLNQESWAYLATAWRLLEDPREHWLCDYDNLITCIDVEPTSPVSKEAFLEALGAALDSMHRASREPVSQSLRGGSQTPGRLFGRQSVQVEEARQALLTAIEKHLRTQTPVPHHPFKSRLSSSVRFAGSWSVKLWSSGRHVNHIHSQGWMSSAFYVALPPSVTSSSEESNAGCIQFGQPPIELELGLAPRKVVRPVPGQLVIFPSYMWHGTLPFSDSVPRVTIAFDMLPASSSR